MVLVAICSAIAAWAVDPNRTTSQYVRQKWGAESGFPRGPVYSIAQTSDGYLWIGTERGLLRFDGFEFRFMQSASPVLPALSHVLGLAADRDGSLWARLQHPAMLLRYKNGIFRDPREDLGHPNASVAAMTPGRDGSLLLWVLEGEPSAIVLRGGKFETLAAPANFSRSPVLAFTQTQNGDLWVGTRDAGLFRIVAGRTFQVTDGLPDLKVNALAPTENGELWVGTDNGIARWNGTKLTTQGVPNALTGVQVLALMVDHDANLWVGTNSQGVARLNSHGLSWMDGSRSSGSDAVTAIFEDREGNLWIGSDHGLERIRDSAFTTYSQAEGMPSEKNGPICVDPAGSLWFAPVQGGLWWIHDGRPELLAQAGLASDVVYSIARGRDGLWIGRQHGGLTLLRSQPGSFAAETYTAGQGLAENSVYSVYESRDGTVWAGTLSGGVSRFSQGHFTTFTADDGLASNTVVSMVQGSDDAMWFATPKGLSAFNHGRWKSFGTGDGLPSANINCLMEDSRRMLWIGTVNGLAFWNAGRIQSVAGAPQSLREQILGVTEDKNGSLWIATSAHVVRVNRDRLLRGARVDGDVREFAIADGLRGVEGVKRSRSVITDQAGRIWLSLSDGISVVDPGRLTSNSTPATVHVTGAVSRRRPDRPQISDSHSGGKKRLTVEYAGLESVDPGACSVSLYPGRL